MNVNGKWKIVDRNYKLLYKLLYLFYKFINDTWIPMHLVLHRVLNFLLIWTYSASFSGKEKEREKVIIGQY